MAQRSTTVQNALESLKIKSLNPMQKACLQAFKKADDLMILSPTGSGKTLGFLLPLLTSIHPKEKGIQALIIVPSRELALQIEQVFRSMRTDFKVNCCYGGHAFKIERNNLATPPAVLIGTPGRLTDHIDRGTFDPDTIKHLVLDEFDKSLEMGFAREMGYIIKHLKFLHKKILTSATSLAELPSFTKIKTPHEINFLKSAKAPQIEFRKVIVKDVDKTKSLISLIGKLGNAPMIIFCSHRDAVTRISQSMNKADLPHSVFHGKLDQEQREEQLIKFRNGSNHLLVATDLAARGLDIPDIKYIIHYQLPPQESSFIHRNGRTARMQASGVCYLILSEEEETPNYVSKAIKKDELTIDNSVSSAQSQKWTTLHINAGRKDKVNKIDIVGLLCKKGGLTNEQIGKIEVQDHSAYVAILANKQKAVLKSIQGERVKKKKIKVEIR